MFILFYIVVYLFENELKDFPRDILSDKLSNYVYILHYPYLHGKIKKIRTHLGSHLIAKI